MPGVAPEPILDVVRGLSTLASFAIVVNQLKNIYDAFYVSDCERCRGTGIVTCPHCHGTKTLRRRPGFLRTRDYGIVDDPRDSYLCFYCGPPSKYDFNPFADDDDQRAMQVQENMRLAVANVFPRLFDSLVTAGTVSCPTCHGNPKVRRLTPDFGKAFDLGPRWDERVAARMGQWFWGAESRPVDKRKLFLEYPSAPVKNPIELPAPRPPADGQIDGRREAEKAAAEEAAKTGFLVSKANDMEGYMLPYASDDED
ncbi:molecular chaperone [Micractinium conductrix]|uniref:Molecular chaperone n=1 Tax=Micractinium conductrix TaxID=554055 RepID=A0A2P6VRF7_9CHLO|nr:molecular chaperone [Micractinium conductrix]|eukprot:PSC76683.1 molecular chaperone [Micractinium conductrix]